MTNINQEIALHEAACELMDRYFFPVMSLDEWLVENNDQIKPEDRVEAMRIIQAIEAL